MSAPITHPSPEELSAFNLGQLPPQAAAAVEDHISECESCCETLLGLGSHDTFLSLLKEAHQPVDESGNPTLLTGSFPRARESQPTIPETLTEHTRYEIVRLIGKGGMGNVFEARHRMMDRTVALKVINHEFVRKPQAVDRFHREVKAAARLSHPNIVTAYDAEQAGDLHFLVMEYVNGIDLAKLVKERGPLSVTDACDYIRQAAVGLQYAHTQGMVHRDIKPHNLMISSDGTVKILDFGLASLAPERLPEAETKETPGELTAAGAIIGTPDFISPEQARDAHQADIRSDIYSLGATLYYLLSGRAPFADANVIEKLQHHAEQEPTPLKDLQIEIPDELADVMRRMMAKDPSERFQTPQEVADALRPFVSRYSPVDVLTPPAVAVPGTATSGSGATFRKFVVGACIGFLCVLASVFYIQLGTATLKFEVLDPDIRVRFGGNAVHIQDGSKESIDFTVKPGTKQEFVLEQHGVTVETDSLVLHRGDRLVLKIDVVAGEIRITPSEPDLSIVRKPHGRKEMLPRADQSPTADVATQETRQKFEALIAAARGTNTDEELQAVTSGYAPMLALLSQEAGSNLIRLLASIPDELHQALLEDGYLKWKADELDPERQQVMLRMFSTIMEQRPRTEDGTEPVIDLDAYLKTSDVGFAVVGLPESKDQVLVWYLLHRDVKHPTVLSLLGSSSTALQETLRPENYRHIHNQVAKLFEQPYSSLPPVPRATPEIRSALLALVDHFPEREATEEQWLEYLTEFAPFLASTNAPGTIGRDLVTLLHSLPRDAQEALLDQGFVKWSFSKLDADQQERIRQIMRGLLSAAPENTQNEKIRDLILASLATADVGFAILELPDSGQQFIAFFAQMPSSRSPSILPVLGGLKDDFIAINQPAVKDQISEIVKLPDSPLPLQGPPLTLDATPDPADAEFVTQFDQLLSAIAVAKTDADWKQLIAEHAPVLSEFPEQIARNLLQVLEGLPETTHRQLLKQGYLKWRFKDLDSARQQSLKTIFGELLAISRHPALDRDTIAQLTSVLDSSDTGFAVLESSGFSGHVLIWYALQPDSPVPSLIPILGVESGSGKRIYLSVHKQLSELEDKPYSALPPDEKLIAEDLQRLQGVWKFDRSAGTALQPGQMSFEIEGTNWTMKDVSTGRTLWTRTVELDPSQDPKHLTLRDAKSSKPLNGIYRLEGDELHVVWPRGGEKRPTEFNTEERDAFYFIMRHESPDDQQGTGEDGTTINHALEFEGDYSGVSLPVPYDGSHPLTLEFTLRLEKSEFDRTQILNTNLFRGPFSLNLTWTQEVCLDFWWHTGGPSEPLVRSKGPFPFGETVHIAAVYTGKEIRLFVNGKLQESQPLPPNYRFPRTTRSINSITLGSLPGGDPPLEFGKSALGLIDEVRISNVARYDKDFTPAKRFETDEDTMALYHFDEGSGTIVRDSSGHNRDGKNFGVKWVNWPNTDSSE